MFSDCLCGELETIEHYLLQCTNFSLLRNTMFHELGQIGIARPNLNMLLNGNDTMSEPRNIKLFISVQKFIMKSKRLKMNKK